MKSITRIQHTNLETVPYFLNISILRMATFSKEEENLFDSIDRHILLYGN